MTLLATLLGLVKTARRAPRFVLSRSGWLTPNPSVHVSLQSKVGSQGIFTFPDTDSGNANAEMHARSLSYKTGLPVVDCRRSA